ncbi:interleukin-6 receptor subunit alpha [Micropterus dolomieu]|uniref:interleukin-6 receptor subunit alpha n=1 Tax=Micropterus dolomieu TaxID=147949 RepID=UPI001E8EE0C5|nr:interleukin-6 receptor subunit alpha [Micropterus dolomieu]
MRKMQIFLPLLCVLCATSAQSIFDGTCLRKDPPPGVLVLSPGSKLVMTCSSHVKVDGVKVHIARNSSNTNRGGSPSDAIPTTVAPTITHIAGNSGGSKKRNSHTVENSVSEGYRSNTTEEGDARSPQHTDTGYTASPTPRTVQPTSVSRQRKGESNLEAEGMDGEGNYEEEMEEEEDDGGEEGSRVTRGIKSRPQWKWNGRMVGKGDRDWGEITFERRGASLSLSSVRLTDSGKYTCYYRGRERLSLKVIVADPPENPSLSCYKKSPTSKIRCEWAPQKPVTILPMCYLLYSKSPTEKLMRLQCSYSPRASRCWCTLDHSEDERRTVHMAYLCVTSIAGNATSALLQFMPLDILKPDPPSHVSVRQEEGQEKRLTVTWSFPGSWKRQDKYYDLIYEVKYKPLMSSTDCEQIQKIERQRSYTITDAMSGVEYMIQLRTKDEFDGVWSDWSTPVSGSSWTVPSSALPSDYDLDNRTITDEGSGSGDYGPYVTEPVQGKDEVPHHVLWISGSFALLSVILAAYLFRHKDRFLSKLQSLSVVSQCGDSRLPSPFAPTTPTVPAVPAVPEGQALVTLGLPRYKKTPLSEVEEGEEESDEEQQVMEGIDAMHFNNTSYFVLQQY